MGIVLLVIFEFVSSLCKAHGFKAVVFHAAIPDTWWLEQRYSLLPPSTFLTVCRVAVSAMKILRAGYWLWILA